MFINIDTSILENVEGSNYLYKQVTTAGIYPENIVIKINESKANNIDKLLSFVLKYKSNGFLIALDDLGTGFSNFERILLIKPDIIKLDRSLIKNIESETYKQEIFKSLVRLAYNIGAIVVAEGIETEIEAYKALEYGAHLLQGFYFAKPEILEQKYFDNTETKIIKMSAGFKRYMENKVREDKNLKKELESKIEILLNSLKTNAPTTYDQILDNFMKTTKNDQIECAYILNEKGKQISNTVFYNYQQDNRKKLLFYPATIGTDHSLKEYFYYLVNARTNKYYSEPYISMATGNVCFTLTMTYTTDNKRENILCIDYKYK